MKRIALVLILAFSTLAATASETPQDRIFQTAFDRVKDKAAIFQPGAAWFPYPEYSDRKAWEELSAPFKEKILAQADKYLDYKWEILRATAYLEYEKTGDRKLSKCEERNRAAVMALTLGELCDGSGKYIPQLMDGLWFMSQQLSWSHFQHTRQQKSGRTLPCEDEYVISLHSAATAACVAIAWHFFKDVFDNYDPSISRTIWNAVDRQVLTPFFNTEQDSGSHRIWTGFDKAPGQKLNNWTPYCDHNVLTTFLLMEKDPDRLLRAVERSVKIMDFYMADIQPDGACDEGPGYWKMSFAKVYEYARTLYDASGGKADVLSNELIRRMGEYKSKTYMDGGWTLSFGDCSPRDAGDAGLLFRYGYDTGSKELMNLALYMLRDRKTKGFKTPSVSVGLGGTYRELETMRYQQKLAKYGERMLAQLEGFDPLVKWLRADIKSEYYPQTGYAILRRGQWNLGCKGSHNAESHNHNDVGSAILIWDTMPVIYDCGVGTYVKETFSRDRYTLWTMQSQWHACPSPNCVQQRNGAQYSSKNTVCNTSACTFSTDIAGAYPEEAHCREWVRSYELTDFCCRITDTYTLDERTAPDQINFLIRSEVALPGESLDGVTAGKSEVLLKVSTFEGGRTALMRMRFTPNLAAYKEVREITDAKLLRCSTPVLTRLCFQSADNAPLTGVYKYEITPVK